MSWVPSPQSFPRCLEIVKKHYSNLSSTSYEDLILRHNLRKGHRLLLTVSPGNKLTIAENLEEFIVASADFGGSSDHELMAEWFLDSLCHWDYLTPVHGGPSNQHELLEALAGELGNLLDASIYVPSVAREIRIHAGLSAAVIEYGEEGWVLLCYTKEGTTKKIQWVRSTDPPARTLAEWIAMNVMKQLGMNLNPRLIHP